MSLYQMPAKLKKHLKRRVGRYLTRSDRLIQLLFSTTLASSLGSWRHIFFKSISLVTDTTWKHLSTEMISGVCPGQW